MSKVNVYYFDNDCAASRVTLDDTFNSTKIESITDTGIQKILLKHLSSYNEIKENKIIEHPELAFSPDGLDILNANIRELNNGKFHKPIKKVRTYETLGNKFAVGQKGNKKKKFVEAAKGTNLFFAVYSSEDGVRSYQTIPLNEVAERQKQGLIPVPEKNANNDRLLFWLSPGDLVYVPSIEEEGRIVEIENNLNCIFNIYKIVSFTGNRLYAIQAFVAASIVDKVEYSLLNKVEFSINENRSIKQYCIKIKTDRLGNIFKL